MTPITRPPALAVARDTVMPALRRAADRLSPAVRAVVGYCQGWLDAHGDPVDAGTGNALRPALALLSAQAAGATAEQGIPAAVAVELVHDFSLLHDDIMDTGTGTVHDHIAHGVTGRRHWPSASTVFGSSATILAGDALLTAAVEVLLEDDSPHAVSAALSVSTMAQRMITGLTADVDVERRPLVTPDEYLAMAGGRTAELLSCAASLGAVVAGAPRHVVAGLAGYGSHLGLAFQLADDIRGIWGDTGSLPVLTDLRARRKSAPVVAALSAGTPAARQLADLLDDGRLPVAARLVEECGGRRWAEQEALRQLAEAQRSLDGLLIPSGVHDELNATARFVVAT